MKQEELDLTIPTGGVPLAIIGIGCLFPQAEDRSAYWANIREGIDAITDIPASHWQIKDYFDKDPKSPDMTYGQRGGFLSSIPFNPMEFNIPPATLEAIDTSQLLGLVAAGQALKDAGYGAERTYDRNRVSVILGVTGTLELVIPLGARLGHPHWREALKDAGVDDTVAEDVVQRISDSYVPWQENSFPGLLGNVVAGRISKNFDLGGTNCVVDAACASSFSALHLAGMELATGKSDMVVTGGIDTFNDIFMYMCFSKTPALSPTGNAKPFDSAGDGTILGEGLGIVVIKRLTDAERDGDRIYAVIKGVGSSSDGKGEAIYTPSASGQKKAILDAYQRAGVTPESIGLVEAHGTGTKVGDAVEVSALREIYGEADNPWCALGSVKSQIGHTKAAAGSAGLIKAALALHHKVIPPTIKVQKPLKEISDGRTPFYLAAEKRPWISRGDAPRRAAVSAFGFGGSNFHTVLEEYRPTNKTADWDGTVQILPFCGPDAATIEAALAAVNAEQPWEQLRTQAAALRATFDATAPCRLALVVEKNRTNLKSLCANALAMLRKSSDTAWSSPDGAFFAAGPAAGTLGLLFPGQGSQYTGMLRDLACCFPGLLDTISAAENGFQGRGNERLSDLIYPVTPFGPDAREQQEEALRATDAAQPAIGAVSLGALRVLESFGVAAQAVAGHSYGELTALCAAERLDESSFHALSRLRGRLMAEGADDKGSMLAVSAPLADVQLMLTEEQFDLVIANCNAPTQAVLSGATSEIERAVSACAARKLTCKKLPVAAAFHSSLVADAAQPLLAALADIPLAAGKIPVYSNTTAAEYPADSAKARELLAGQLARPVEFVAEIEAMYAAGVRTFVECGPGARLSGLVKAILADQNHTVTAIDASGGKRSGIADLARCLAQIAVLGHDVDLVKWDEGYQPPVQTAGKKPAMTIPLCGANYVKPKAKRPPVPPSKPAVTAATAPVHMSPGIVAGATISQDALAESLRVTREGMSVLQRMQEETASLHRRFLEGQETASRTIQTLLEQQQRIFQGGGIPLAAPAMVSTPVAFSPPKPAPPVSLSDRSDRSDKSDLSDLSDLSDKITTTLLAVVSEKTGYPVEMLELEMGMDSDLGIDSIKRVEILSALQERLPGSPVIGPEHMGSLQTLGEIARHLGAGTAQASDQSDLSDRSDKITTTLLAVVSEKTGYPVEMLELEMGMDSDLGIDSIKRVEILSALQERLPGSPVIGPEHMGSLQTLGEIARHLGAGTAQTSDRSEKITATLLEVVSEKTGYPVEMLELEMGMDSDLGIDSIKRVEILSALQERLPGSPVIGPEHMGSLQTLGEIARHLGAGTAQTSDKSDQSDLSDRSDKITTTLPSAPGTGLTRSTVIPVALDATAETISILKDGIIWVTDDGSPFSGEVCANLSAANRNVQLINPGINLENLSTDNICGLVILAPAAGSDDIFLENAFLLLKKAAPALLRSVEEGGALFSTVSRLDGAFGCGTGNSLADPLSGGLAGLVKTAAREWPGVTCKAIDLGAFPDTAAAAGSVAGELFMTGPVEVGLNPAGRTTLALTTLPSLSAASSAPLESGDVVVVTGGGRGVTAATAIALAAAYRPMLLLLGRSPEPQSEPAWLTPLSDESSIKRAILEHATEKLHPKEIEERYRAVIAGRELTETLARIEAVGGRAIYRALDIRDSGAVNSLLDSIRREHGPIRGIVHGAGVLADRLILDKTREQFAKVYGTKVVGLRTLLAATAGDDLRCIVLFGSTTGRFGRTGQVDYAVANEVLNKLAQSESRRRPVCRTVCINWGPWDGGMVTPALKKVFTGEGIGLISLKEGGELLVREIAATDAPVEVVALAGDATAPLAINMPTPPKPLLEAFSLTLTVQDYPFIRSHVIDGKAVLPMAMIVEWLGHGALHGNPGFRFHGFNDLRICKGIVFDQDTACILHVMAGRAQKQDSLYFVPVELTGSSSDGRSVLHARAEIVLATKLPEGIRSIVDLPATPYAQNSAAIYDRERLFHGPALQGIEQVGGCSAKGISALIKAAPKPETWVMTPLRNSWLTDPLVIDSAFQLMILWSFERFGAGSLPSFAGRYRQFQDSFPREGAQIVIRVTSEREHGASADMEFLDRNSGKLIARLEDYECVIDPSLQRAFRRNQLSQPGCVELEAA
ncbi:MAG: SDR family NAD(P)-dependent oxidoreductase [Desulfuromonadales bacterium]|nr:SDR family NAD(P)-dependent oxidoreductase [Desulfuromonadales bacterium]